MNIKAYAFDGEGMTRVFENKKWMVGIKNWKPMNDISGIDRLERHHETDELFVLISGTCTLLYANEGENGLDIGCVKMEQGKVYSIPAGLWHNTVTEKSSKLVLIEDSVTCAQNSSELLLDEKQLNAIRAMVK